jgi:hypothetical protein
MALSAASVADRLGLGEDYGGWLADLEALGSPPGGINGTVTEARLRRLGFAAQDARAVLDALPPPLRGSAETTADEDEALHWLFERAVHAARLDVGHIETTPRTPALPPASGARGRLFWVFVYLAAVEAICDWHRQRGVPDAITWATLQDLGRHVGLFRRRTGQTGLDTQWWLGLHFRGALFALGRLQFNPFRLCTGPAGPRFWYADNPPRPDLRPGQVALGIHIPESGPLTPAAVDASLIQARHFFEDHLPEHATRIAVCTSWLLDQQLADYLPAESNIVRFQRRFTLLPGSTEADASPFHFVFGTSPAAAPTLKPRTTLERALLSHLEQGKHWAMRTGWLDLGP